MPTSAAASLLSRIDSAGFAAFSEVSRSAMPGTLATFCANSVISAVSVSGSGPSRFTHTGRSQPNASSMPGTGFNCVRIARSISFCERFAVLALDELQVDAGVVAPLLGADRRHRQRDFGNVLQHCLDLLHLAVGVLEARAHRRIESQRDEALVGLGYELGPDERHDREAREERGERDRDHALAMAERPFEHRAVDGVQPLDEALDLVHEPAEPRHALEPRSRRIVPYRREHRVEREARRTARRAPRRRRSRRTGRRSDR